ncbi:DUF4139 domain-containing protein [Kordiimonas gwangyangensis]|uniref:DUF4139 domain-containing protein n=1 Tax=Kordiimonas gwangyangensis TaxID=288022 RepID=UPI0003628862|nr:DUF4139 domain-containing protein [Kordiimonas gwangyangensis]
MKPQLSVFPVLAVLASSGVYADDFTMAAPIEAVTVYQTGGAVVHRKAKLSLPKGNHTVTVTGLTSQLDSGYGIAAVAGGLEVSNIRTTTNYMPTEPSAALKALEARYMTARKALSTTENSLAAIEMRLTYLRGLGESGPAAKDWQAALDFIGNKTADLMAEKFILEQKQMEQNEVVKGLQQEIMASGGRSDATYAAVVNVTADKAGEYEFDVSYLVRSARWGMVTDANLLPEKKQADITLKAEVSQSSGEAWDDVALSLSTSRPAWNIAAPIMFPDFLRARDKDDYSARMEMAMPAPAAAQFDGARERKSSNAPVMSQTATTYDMNFTLNMPASLPANGTPQQYPVKEVGLPAEIVTRITPRYDSENAYVYADVTMEGLPRLSNISARLSRDGYYAGRGTWPNLVPGENVKLPFGADSGITVETITIPSNDGDTGFFGKRKVEEERVIYKVTNNRDKAATVEVTDRLPVSAHEDVKVETLKGATPATSKDVDGKAGVITWKRELKPGETWEIHHEYRVTYPGDMRLDHSGS